MLSQVLRRDVEAYAERLRSSSRLLQRARAGELQPAAVSTYLEGLRYLLGESQALLTLAGRAAERTAAADLAAYYFQKANEERGHDRWAANDILSLSQRFSVNPRPGRSRALSDLVKFLAEEIEAQPERFLAYQLLAEYITVIVGPDWLDSLERHCGIERSCMSAVYNHVRLDEDHVDEDFAVIDVYVSASSLSDLRNTIHRSTQYFDAFFDEVAECSVAA
jgi:hypothetical protein